MHTRKIIQLAKSHTFHPRPVSGYTITKNNKLVPGVIIRKNGVWTYDQHGEESPEPETLSIITSGLNYLNGVTA